MGIKTFAKHFLPTTMRQFEQGRENIKNNQQSILAELTQRIDNLSSHVARLESSMKYGIGSLNEYSSITNGVVAFKNFVKTRTTTAWRLDFVVYEKWLDKKPKTKEIYFEMNAPIDPSDDLIAYTLASYCGRIYQRIFFDLCLHEETIDNIEAFTDSKTNCRTLILHEKSSSPQSNNRFRATGDEPFPSIALAFSGGLDSLAAKMLMPENTRLFSVNYEGRERESASFLLYNPVVLSTNLRKTIRVYYHNWTALCSAALLCQETYPADFVAAGRIFEDYPEYHLFNQTIPDCFFPHSFLGVNSLWYTLGLTQIGTALVCARSLSPEELRQALDSLESVGTIKRYRKECILKILWRKYHIGIEINNLPLPEEEKKISFGSFFSEDFLMPYFVKNLGIQSVSAMLVDIPECLAELAASLSMDFYERFLPTMSGDFPPQLGREYLRRLKEIGISDFNENDIKELNIVLDTLDEYHHFNNKDYAIIRNNNWDSPRLVPERVEAY